VIAGVPSLRTIPYFLKTAFTDGKEHVFFNNVEEKTVSLDTDDVLKVITVQENKADWLVLKTY
jgi:hypothetical protein